MRPPIATVVATVVAAVATAGAAHAGGNLVVDGSFSAGLSSWNPRYVEPSDSQYVYSFSGTDEFGTACSGLSCLASGPTQTLTLTQLVTAPATGLYRLSFDIRSLITFSSESAVSASFGGVRLYHSAATEIGEWNHVSLLTTVTASATPLSFDFVAPAGYYYLSNVSLVSAVPEPHSYLMLLAGLAVVGWAVRRRAG